MILTSVRLAGAVVADQRGDLAGVDGKSTSCSTCTAPKLLLTPRSSSSGCAIVALPSAESVVRGTEDDAGPGGPARASRPLRGRPDRDQEMPASVHRSANSPVHTSAAFWPPSSMTSLTLSLVIDCGSSRIEGTSRSPSESSTCAGGLGLLAVGQRDGGVGQRAGLPLGGLVDRHALVAGEDVLQALDGGVLAGDRDLAGLAVALEDADGRAAETVVGREHAVDLAVRAV